MVSSVLGVSDVVQCVDNNFRVRAEDDWSTRQLDFLVCGLDIYGDVILSTAARPIVFRTISERAPNMILGYPAKKDSTAFRSIQN